MNNHQHYRYLKELWMLLNKEENINVDNDKREADDEVIFNIRKYGLSIINYAIKNQTYLKFSASGTDTSWTASKDYQPNIFVKYDTDGIIKVGIDRKEIRFVVLCSPPESSCVVPKDTYILVYDNLGKCQSSHNIIPISLNDISSVERVATIIREYLLREYLGNTIFRDIDFPRTLQPYIETISAFCETIKIDKKSDTYRFMRFPKNDIDWNGCLAAIKATSDFSDRSRPNQNEILKYFKEFTDSYVLSANQLQDNLRCFALDCETPFESWYCDNLNYIQCNTCGATLDCTHTNHITFKENNDFSKEELGMDYLEISFDYKSQPIS